jgi:hypothetical protein
MLRLFFAIDTTTLLVGQAGLSCATRFVPCTNPIRTLRAVCAEFYLASIGVAVHRGGNPVQKFFRLAKLFYLSTAKIYSRARLRRRSGRLLLAPVRERRTPFATKKRDANRCVPSPQNKLRRIYSTCSFSTTTLIVALISRNTLIVTVYSPSALIGSAT